MRYLVVYMPLLALEWECPFEGPRALIDKSARRIVLANQRADLCGVDTGIALETALSLCQDLHTEIIDERVTEKAIYSLALELGRWSARISFVDQHTLLAEVASMRRYFKGVKPLVEAVAQMLTEQRLSYQLGLAQTPRAALALARANATPLFSEALIDQQLVRLPLYTLDITDQDRRALSALGITQIGMLENLPRQELASRFSTELLLRLDQLRDRIAWTLPAFIPPETFYERVDLQAEINHTQGLLFPFQRLIKRLEGFLQLRQKLALRLDIVLKHRDLTTAQLYIGHAGGCYLADEWLALLRLKLERYRFSLPVIELELSVDQFREWDAPAEDMFDAVKGAESPEQLLNRIQIRLGKRAISYLSVPPSHLPLLSDRSTADQPAIQQLPRNQRPLWLLASPEQLTLARVGVLKFLAGPERIQTAWWQQVGLRDYFKVGWPDGRLAWVFRDQYQRWFLHGWFS